MLVMNVMSSKRQRRPNVRLGEIGDMSAAWACGFSHRNRGKFAHKEWKNDFIHQTVGDEDNPIVYGDLNLSFPKTSELGVSPQISTELQQNGENNINPNSSDLALECPISTELIDMTKSKLKFSDVTRKSRGMKRRGRNKNGYAILGGSWSSKHSSDDFSMDEKECEGTGNSATGFGDSSDHQTPTTSKEEYGIDQPSTRQECKLNNNAEFTGKEARYKSSNVQDEMRIEDDDTNAVSRWLEEVGFGKYAGVFEIHEVDEEALPLLTIEDLKEIGVLSVGSRRKLYNAIQQLRGVEDGEESV